AASDFNQALMELGALVCTPRAPYCLTCPVMEHCAGRLAGMEESLPIKKKSKPPRQEARIVALIEGSGSNEGKVLIRQRPQEGLLARMWELPHYAEGNDIAYVQDRAIKYKLTDEENICFLHNQLEEGYGVQVLPGHWFMNTEHIFSHIHWNMKVYRFKSELAQEFDVKAKQPTLPSIIQPSEQYQWITLDEMDKYPFPNVFLRILKAYAESAWVLVE
ncbi:MAG TPA: NUDIX domain-containing protein, partial [Bacilli bacterium]